MLCIGEYIPQLCMTSCVYAESTTQPKGYRYRLGGGGGGDQRMEQDINGGMEGGRWRREQ